MSLDGLQELVNGEGRGHWGKVRLGKLFTVVELARLSQALFRN